RRDDGAHGGRVVDRVDRDGHRAGGSRGQRQRRGPFRGGVVDGVGAVVVRNRRVGARVRGRWGADRCAAGGRGGHGERRHRVAVRVVGRERDDARVVLV